MSTCTTICKPTCGLHGKVAYILKVPLEESLMTLPKCINCKTMLVFTSIAETGGTSHFKGFNGILFKPC